MSLSFFHFLSAFLEFLFISLVWSFSQSKAFGLSYLILKGAKESRISIQVLLKSSTKSSTDSGGFGVELDVATEKA